MKKKVFRERYYGDIEATGENFGKTKVNKEKTTVVEIEEKPKKRGRKSVKSDK